MTRIRNTAAILAVTALCACDTVTGATLFNKTTSAYDGAWVGTMTVGYRLAECRLTRGGLRIRIDGGEMEGQARFELTAGEVKGVVAEDGTIAYASLRGQYAKDDVEFQGKFSEKTAEGTWANKVCNGKWELSKAR